MSSRGPISKISNKCGAKTLPFFWYNLIFSPLLFKVIWTDVFQLFFMFLSVLIMVILATSQAGGAAAVWDRNYQADFYTLSWSDWSTLIGPGMSRLDSHWSRASLVMLAPAVVCHKEPVRASKAPYYGLWNAKYPHCIGGYFACSSLVLYVIRDSWLPCTERSYYRSQ